MIRVIYDCEPKYIVRVNSLVQQPFIAMLCKPYSLQYVDYDIMQADDGQQRPDHAPQRF